MQIDSLGDFFILVDFRNPVSDSDSVSDSGSGNVQFQLSKSA